MAVQREAGGGGACVCVFPGREPGAVFEEPVILGRTGRGRGEP